MALVDYPDSESDSEGESVPLAAQPPSSTTAVKRKRSNSELPPLPAAFHDLYSTNARIGTSDDPSLHGGRTRAVPHIEGNWPSHVYIEWVPSQTESHVLHRLIHHIREAIEQANKSKRTPLPVPDITPSLRSPLGAALPLHISLSRTLQIKTDQRETFSETLKALIRKATVQSFHVRFSSLKWVPNFERNRWFLVLGLEKPAQNELNRLLDACNEATEKCGYLGLYTGGIGDGPMEGNTSNDNVKRRKSTQPDVIKDKGVDATSTDRTRDFHVSIAWNLIEPDPEWLALVQDIAVPESVDLTDIHIEAVKLKIGNAVTNINLDARRHSGVSAGGGLLGLG